MVPQLTPATLVEQQTHHLVVTLVAQLSILVTLVEHLVKQLLKNLDKGMVPQLTPATLVEQ